MSSPQSARKIQSLSEPLYFILLILLNIRHHLLIFCYLPSPIILFLAVLVTLFYNKKCVIIFLFTEFLILQSQNRNHIWVFTVYKSTNLVVSRFHIEFGCRKIKSIILKEIGHSLSLYQQPGGLLNQVIMLITKLCVFFLTKI